MAKKFKSGFVTLIGRPNVGKSTLMNMLIGEKISIISSKPQTTRNKIQTILTTDNAQVVFIDTPGLHTAKSKLGEYMVKSAETTMNDVDLVLYLIEPFEKIKDSDKAILDRLKNVTTPVFLVINKIDTINKEELFKIISEFKLKDSIKKGYSTRTIVKMVPSKPWYGNWESEEVSYKEVYDFKEIIPISALKQQNKEDLLKHIEKYLPEGPKYFPEDMITDQPEKQIVSEIIREKALYLLQEEIPHGIAVEVTSMKKRKEKDIYDIDATIYCERDSHKGIIIGKQGSMLKKIGTNARKDIQRFLGTSINLQLWIKVKKGWRDNDFLLKNFGYDSKQI